MAEERRGLPGQLGTRQVKRGSRSAQAFKELVAQIGDALKERAFTRYGPTFSQERGGNWGLIEFQRSQKTSADKIVFTVNLGVVSGRLARFFSVPLEKGGRPPGTSEWHWRQRLGFLLPERQDQWWTVGDGSEVDLVCQTIREALLGLALPEIDKHLQDESLRDLWLTGRSPGLTNVQRLKSLAVLLKALGPNDRLTSVLDDLRGMSTANALLLERRLQVGVPA